MLSRSPSAAMFTGLQSRDDSDDHENNSSEVYLERLRIGSE
ncbi:unnamed protein product [Victoria cruziana]